jgi:hypothetical protein
MRRADDARQGDLPLNFHPAAIRVSADFTPSGAGRATCDRRSWSELRSRSDVAVRSAVFAPASCSRSTPIICCSVNLARFICPSFTRPDSNSAWRKFAVAGHVSYGLLGQNGALRKNAMSPLVVLSLRMTTSDPKKYISKTRMKSTIHSQLESAFMFAETKKIKRSRNVDRS